MLARILDAGDKVEIVRELGRLRQEHVQAAFSSLHAQRWTDQLRRSFSWARESGQRMGQRIFLEEIHPPVRAWGELGPICERRSLVLVFELIRHHPRYRRGRYGVADGGSVWRFEERR